MTLNKNTMRDIAIVYGAYINVDANWRKLIRLQLESLAHSGVLARADLHVVVTNPSGVEGVSEYFETLPVSICQIDFHRENRFEYPAISRVWDLAHAGCYNYIAYLHTKGMSYAKEERTNLEETLTGLTFSNWRKIRRIFDSCPWINKIGVFPARHDGYPSAWIWYNFWWARPSFIKSLPKPVISTDRHLYEVWLGLSPVKEQRKRDWYSILTRDQSMFFATETILNISLLQKYGRFYRLHRRWNRYANKQYIEPEHVHKCHLTSFVNPIMRENRVMTPPVIRGDGVEQPKPFSKLDEKQSEILTRDRFDLANRVILAGTTPIETMTFSAWLAHAPVLFCLFEILKPRRYVELGSHQGYSFFAACQASEIANSKTECIAIDNWEGDKHAGFYGSAVYDAVRRRLALKYPHQFTIRASFSDALLSFEEGSVDLLHIDGLHTYDAVKNDFETWLPKMSDRGVILFHDTNVFEKDFGVYIFWQGIKEHYPSFEFRHQSGLGILFVGKDEGIASVFRLLSGNADYSVLLQNLMLRVADLNVSQLRATNEGKEIKAVVKQLLPREKLESEIRKYRTKLFLAYPFARRRRRYRNKIRLLQEQQTIS